MKLNGVEFRNSESCEGTTFIDPAANIDIAVIKITGRYPESGWAVNRMVHELVYVKQGVGSLTVRGTGETQLSEGSVVSVAPGERFVWDGNMTIIMACNPPFNPDQYDIEEEI